MRGLKQPNLILKTIISWFKRRNWSERLRSANTVTQEEIKTEVRYYINNMSINPWSTHLIRKQTICHNPWSRVLHIIYNKPAPCRTLSKTHSFQSNSRYSQTRQSTKICWVAYLLIGAIKLTIAENEQTEGLNLSNTSSRASSRTADYLRIRKFRRNMRNITKLFRRDSTSKKWTGIKKPWVPVTFSSNKWNKKYSLINPRSR